MQIIRFKSHRAGTSMRRFIVMKKENSIENSDDDVADGFAPDSRIVEIVNRIELARSNYDDAETAAIGRAS